MAIAEHIQAESRLLLHGIDWPTYVALRDGDENNHVRMTYDRGELEMVSPSKSHEQAAHMIGWLITVWAEVRGIDIQSCRTMTIRREDLQRGLEPDNCYYVAHELLVRQKTELDLVNDPPPDLAIEVDLGSGGVGKLTIYAALRVPEVWRYDGRALQIYALDAGGQYQPHQQSISFPELPPAEIVRVLGQLGTASETALARSFRQWALSVAE